MLEAILGGLAGFLLGSAIIYLWARARTKTDAARIAELEEHPAHKCMQRPPVCGYNVQQDSTIGGHRGSW